MEADGSAKERTLEDNLKSEAGLVLGVAFPHAAFRGFQSVTASQ